MAIRDENSGSSVDAPSQVPSQGRPKRDRFWRRLLAVVFLALAILGWVRFAEALRSWSLLTNLGVTPGPLYLALSGALWGLVGLPSAVGLWFGDQRVFPYAVGAALFYPLTYWIDRLWIAQPGEGFTNVLFAIGVTIIWLVYAGLVLARFRQSWV